MMAKREPQTDPNIAERMPPSAQRHGKMPGGRAALPEGSLPATFEGPQSDEQRDPPAGSPAPVRPAPIVEREARAASGLGRLKR